MQCRRLTEPSCGLHAGWQVGVVFRNHLADDTLTDNMIHVSIECLEACCRRAVWRIETERSRDSYRVNTHNTRVSEVTGMVDLRVLYCKAGRSEWCCTVVGWYSIATAGCSDDVTKLSVTMSEG